MKSKLFLPLILILTPALPAEVIEISEGQWPSLAGSNGKWIVCWQKDDGTGDIDLHARIYDSTGKPLCEAFEIGDDSHVSAAKPYSTEPCEVGMDSKGRVVVAWQSLDEENRKSQFFRRFDSSGKPLGEVQSPFGRASDTIGAELAVAADGHFAIASSKPDKISIARYSLDGSALKIYHKEAKRNGMSMKMLSYPMIALRDGGELSLVYWQKLMNLGSKKSTDQLLRQRIGIEGNNKGSAILHSASKEDISKWFSMPHGGSVSLSPTGNLHWCMAVSLSQNGAPNSENILSGWISESGEITPPVDLTDPQPIPSLAAFGLPSITHLKDGSSVVVWSQSQKTHAGPSTCWQRFSADGSEAEMETLIPPQQGSKTAGGASCVAAIDSTKIAIVWSELSQFGSVGSIKAWIAE